jgi:hypothetical protein
MSSANRDSLTSSFTICIPYICSSCLIALAMNSKTMLNKSGESGHLCLIPDFRGNFYNFFPIVSIVSFNSRISLLIFLSGRPIYW